MASAGRGRAMAGSLALLALGVASAAVAEPVADPLANLSRRAPSTDGASPEQRASTWWLEEQKLTANDAAPQDEMGHAVGISGTTAVVGTPRSDGAGADSGSAVVFVHAAGSWSELTVLTATAAAAGDRFGHSVATSGDDILVGANGDNSASGSVFVFYRNQGGANAWGQVDRIRPVGGLVGDQLGFSVDLSGDTTVSGAVGDANAGANTGAAYVYDRDFGGQDSWGQVRKLVAVDAAAGSWFGWSVAVDGDTIVVGAPYADISFVDSGAAYVFERDQGGQDGWGQVRRLVASDRASGDYFGVAVAIAGDIVVVAAPWDDDQGQSSGSLYVFERNAGGAGAWGQVAKVVAGDGSADDRLGWAVDLAGTTVAAAADGAGDDAGAIYLFARDEGGVGAWGQVDRITPSDAAGGDAFGYSLSVADGRLVAGARFEDDGGSSSGAAYVFAGPLFVDGFETATTGAWSATVN